MNFYFNPMAFVDNLKYLGIGWLSIFIVIGVIMCITYLLNYTTQTREKKSDDDK